MKRSLRFGAGGALLLAAVGWYAAPAAVESAAIDEPGITDTGRAIVLTTEPIDLPAMRMEEGHEHGGHEGIFPPVQTLTVPVHGYLYGFEYEVVDGQGNPVPREVVHHFNIIDPDRRELFLPISLRILAAGKETGDQAMPRFLMGVPVVMGQRLVLTVMLHNPTGVDYEDAQLRVTLKYQKVGRPWPFFEVFPFQMDVAFPAGDKSFDLPPGESAWSWEGQPSMEGRMMVVGSHLHELATHIELVDVTDDKVVWTGLPVYEDEGELTGITIGHLYRRGGAKVDPEHTYRVTVYYDNPAPDTLIAGGMGVVGGVFMPSGGGMWPRADTRDPLYALDRQHYMREVHGSYEQIVDGGAAVTADDHADASHSH